MNPHHLHPLSVQIVLWMTLIVCDLSVSLVSLFGVVYSSLIDPWVLVVIFDLSLSIDCSLGGVEFLAWKAMSSHFAGTVITLEDFLRLFLKNSFYALLCGRSVCTTLVLLNINFSTFISLANVNSFTSCQGATFPRNRFFCCSSDTPCLIFVYIIAVSTGVVSPGFCTCSLNSFL